MYFEICHFVLFLCSRSLTLTWIYLLGFPPLEENLSQVGISAKEAPPHIKAGLSLKLNLEVLSLA
jgi:hypothetical protein